MLAVVVAVHGLVAHITLALGVVVVAEMVAGTPAKPTLLVLTEAQILAAVVAVELNLVVALVALGL